MGMAILDGENSATVQFNEWLQGVDDAVTGVGRREPLPPGGILLARRPTIPFAKWLLWVDRSVLPLGGQRQSLPASNFALVGLDLKPTIPFFSWCRYVDKTLP